MLVGCTERALPIGVAIDGGVAIDASTPRDAGACVPYHVREVVPIASARAIDGADTFPTLAATRLLIELAVRGGCDVPADVTVDVQAGNATTAVLLTAHAWIGSDGCGPATLASRVITIPAAVGSNAFISVIDGASKVSPPLLTLHAMGSFQPSCGPLGLGSSCTQDCQCSGTPRALCLTREDGVRACGIPCNEDGECRDQVPDQQTCVRPLAWACGSQQRCKVESECPYGQTIEDCRCVPAPERGGGPCACDADCDASRICAGGACVQPCTAPHTCAHFGEGEGGTACWDGACVQLI